MLARSALLAVPLLVALLAGCFGGGPAETSTSTTGPGPAAPELPVFAKPARVGPGDEPGLRVGNGTVWVHAPGHLWRSANGTAWTAVDPGPALGVFGNDADLAIGRDGALYYTDLQLLTSISVYASTDDGATWFYHPVASVVPGDDRQWIATGPDAGPLKGGGEAVYLAYNQLGTSPWVTKSTDGGKTWAGRVVDPAQPQATFWSMGNIIVEPKDGAVHVIYTVGYALHPVGDENVPVDWKVLSASSADGGLTWSVATVADPDLSPGHIVPVIAADGNGTLYAAWSQSTPQNEVIQMSVSRDAGATWAPAVDVTGANGTAIMPWIDARGDGHVALAWYGTNVTRPSDAADGDWYVHLATSTDANRAQPHFAQSLVWGEPIRKGPICTLGIMCNGNRQLADFFEVRLDDAGFAHVAFADTAHGSDASVYYARQVAGPTL